MGKMDKICLMCGSVINDNQNKLTCKKCNNDYYLKNEKLLKLARHFQSKLTTATKRIEDMKCCGNCSHLDHRDCNNKKSDLYKEYPQPDDKCQYWKQSNR
jgi:hypothetical protein